MNYSIMIKPASSGCNLRCRYCFYEDESALRSSGSHGLMRRDTMETVIGRVFASLKERDEVTFAFQGGEPTLAGIGFFRDFTDLVDEKKKELPGVAVSYLIQTNATLFDEQWCRLFLERDFLVGVSLDLHRGSHDGARVTPEGKGTFDRVLAAVSLLKEQGVKYNILCTLTDEIAMYPRKVWKLILQQDFEYVQFTPCMDGLEGKNGYGLTPERFASFYREIFDLWYEDFLAGRKRSIKLFDDVANLLLFGMRTACGIDGHCSPQIIVEADGSVYPCDFYCLDRYKLGSLAEVDLSEIYRRSKESPAGAPEPSKRCTGCRYLSFCGGGCKRMRRNICFAEDGDSYCGYEDLLDHIIPELNALRYHG